MLFDNAIKWVDLFVPMDTKVVEGSKVRRRRVRREQRRNLRMIFKEANKLNDNCKSEWIDEEKEKLYGDKERWDTFKSPRADVVKGGTHHMIKDASKTLTEKTWNQLGSWFKLNLSIQGRGVHILWENMTMKPDPHDLNALDNMRRWRSEVDEEEMRWKSERKYDLLLIPEAPKSGVPRVAIPRPQEHRVFEHMARVYNVPTQRAYNTPGYDQQ
ncbi:hypothetical protein Tco_0067230 [Tanacetum coccineum]